MFWVFAESLDEVVDDAVSVSCACGVGEREDYGFFVVGVGVGSCEGFACEF